MKFVIFTLVILVKCITVNSDEDSTASMEVSERLAKTEIFTEDYTFLKEKAGDVEDNPNIEKIEGYDEGLSKLRTISDFSLGEVTDFYDLISTKDSVTEKIVEIPEEVETKKDGNDSIKTPKILRKSSEFLQNQDNKKSETPKAVLIIKDIDLEKVTEYYNSSDVISTEDYVTKKVVKQDRQEEKITEKEENYNLNKPEILKKSSELVQNENSNTSEIHKAVLKIEERKPEDILEASAERKLDLDIKMLPSILEKSGGKSDSDTVEIKKKSHKLNLDKPIATRRFYFNSDVDVDANTKLEDTNANPGLKIAPSDFNEFAFNSDRNLIKLIIDHLGSNNNKLTITPATVAMKSRQIVTPLRNSELLNPYLTKMYLTHGLNLFSPLSEVQLQRPVPIYMELKFDEILSRIHMVGIHNPQSSAVERRKGFDRESQQHERVKQNLYLDRKEPANLNIEYIYDFKDQIKGILEPKLSSDYIQFQNLKQKPKKYPNNIQSHNLRFGDQVQSPMSERFGNIKQEKIYFQPFHHNQALASTDIENSLDGTGDVVYYSQGRRDSEKFRKRFTNPYSYIESSNAPDLKIVEATKNYDPNSQSFKTLFHKLVQASRQPRQFTSSNLYT